MTKKWYQSKTIGGIILAIIGAVFMFFGMDTGVELPANADAEQIKAYYEQIKAADGNISTIIGIGVSAVGYLMALIGRVKAETKVTL